MVAVNRGELDITGDNNNNGVQVAPVPNTTGQFTVTGLNDDGATTINGQAAVTVSGVTDKTKIALGDGNDDLVVNNGAVFPQDLHINLGSGANSVSIANVTVDGDLKIQNRTYDTSSSSGNDNITLMAVTVLQDTKIQTGNGNDTATISSSTFEGQLEVDFGNGTDSLTVQNSTVVGQFRIEEGSGADTINIFNNNNTFEGGVQIRSGSFSH